MSIFHVLYKSYIKAEENGQVDAPELDTTNRNIVILPIYHANLRSEKEYDIAQIILDDDGVPNHINFVDKDAYVVFPVTEKSVNRTSNISAHPLCDYMPYLSKRLDEEKYANFCEQNIMWLEGICSELAKLNSKEAGRISTFLSQIGKLILNEDVLTVSKNLIKKSYKVLVEEDATVQVELESDAGGSRSRKRKIDLSKVFVTFGKQFSDPQKRDIDTTTNKILHEAHIRYIQRMQANKTNDLQVCDISGQKMYNAGVHRGLYGRRKIIGESHAETHIGRFQEYSEVIRVGADTSEKIHLMLKFFLEHPDNVQELSKNTTAVIWFAEDLLNERQFQLSNPTMDPWDNPDDGYESTTLADEKAKEWKKILRGEKPLSDDWKEDFFYLLMINKVSKGRLAIQSTRTIPMMIFLKNLMHWQQTCSWEIRSSKTGKCEDITPRPQDIIRFIYGIEGDDGWVDCLNDELMSIAFKRLLPSIIDGVPLPKDMARQIFSKYKNRIGFRKNWKYLQFLSCALLNKARQDGGKERRIPMLEKEKQTRDYLYGRLLAVYEKIEMDAMTSSDKKNETESKTLRITNVEKVWAAFFQAPERMLETLHMKISPYLKKLKANQAGRYFYYNKLIGEIQTEIRDAETYIVNKNKALNEDAVFGYYAQNKDLYTSRAEKKENENAE